MSVAVHTTLYAVVYTAVHAVVAHPSHSSELPGAQLPRHSALSRVQLLGPSAGPPALLLLPVNLSPLVCSLASLCVFLCVRSAIIHRITISLALLGAQSLHRSVAPCPSTLALALSGAQPLQLSVCCSGASTLQRSALPASSDARILRSSAVPVLARSSPWPIHRSGAQIPALGAVAPALNTRQYLCLTTPAPPLQFSAALQSSVFVHLYTSVVAVYCCSSSLLSLLVLQPPSLLFLPFSGGITFTILPFPKANLYHQHKHKHKHKTKNNNKTKTKKVIELPAPR